MSKDLYIILGVPGSGKTTQAFHLAQYLKLDNLSWGTIYRNPSLAEKYPKEFKTIKSKKASDKDRSYAISNIIEKEVEQLSETSNGFIIDGYPRRLTEAKRLIRITKKGNYNIRGIIIINPSLETSHKRLKERLICKRCGNYYSEENPPLPGGFCKDDSQKLNKAYISPETLKDEFYIYRKEIAQSIRYLQKYTDVCFDVSGDDDETIIFSNILLKLRDRKQRDSKIFSRRSKAKLETKFGVFDLIAYQSEIDYSYHLALVKGDVKRGNGILIRIHSSCVTGDIFASERCDCGDQLHNSLKLIHENRKGVLIYLFQEGRGINIINKVKAYELQRKGLDTVEANERIGFPAEMREYSMVKDILDDLHIKSIKLMTNNPDKIYKLTDLGIIVEESVSIEVQPGKHNKKYLYTKRAKMKHKLCLV
ncbi:MAG: GTP cyclohydrolase II [Candidatus Blackburnbacteria bacterium RIFCSPLOWO2_01_FULL_41_27]|uniref:GTP cyclohydrolase-2 n=2 Tax=Candidatus Blackburniibacteriota TaxID=1817898 RepID=A0A1G1V9S3_9BACT|nr:MAG: GTP cyclohydrolase II [Candidatus Blackburnbacteria bacterium RIFCSPHIGHO2_12_FULL_41_13b]OGY15013.1 MAG: GTP cyclohydrolase II [Candidatus Blackburnbacteria bacterium RIFCSPLOWO2_01_FULL_41_27]